MQEVLVLSIGGDQHLVNFTREIDRHCGAGWVGLAATTEAEAGEILRKRIPEIALVDSTSMTAEAADILDRLVRDHPATLRYALTDINDKAHMFRLMDAAHQVIAKPWEPSGLAKRLQNSLRLREILSDDRLRAKVAGVKSLPCLPETYTRLVAELRGDRVSIKRIADLISSDAAVTAKLLQVVNSAYFGLSGRVEDVLHAVGLVGLDTVQNLVLSAGVFQQFQETGIARATVNRIHNASTSVGARSRLLAHSFGLHKRDVDDSLLGGTLHDIGLLLMLQCFPEEYKEALALKAENELPLFKAEEKVLGVNDASLGAYLLSLWGLSNSVVEAVALHHRPSRCARPALGPLAVVHLAWAIDTDEHERIRDERASLVDTEYLAALGLQGQLAALRGFCSGATA